MVRIPAARLLAALAALPLVAAAAPLSAQSGAFGHSVVIEGGEILITEPTTSFRPGAVYVYRKAGGEWRESRVLRAPDPERADGFGTLLAKSGNTLFVGQRGGPVHVFERSGASQWRATGTIEGEDIAGMEPSCGFDGYCGTDFGLSLAADGEWLLVGVPGAAPAPRRRPGAQQEEADQGVVYVYQRDTNGQWTRTGRLQPDDGTGGDGFGAAMAFTRHGLLIGAPNWNGDGADQERTGRVYQYSLVDGGWEMAGALESATDRTPTSGLRWRPQATASWSVPRARAAHAGPSTRTPGTPAPCGTRPPATRSRSQTATRATASARPWPWPETTCGSAPPPRAATNSARPSCTKRGPTVRCPPSRAASSSPRR